MTFPLDTILTASMPDDDIAAASSQIAFAVAMTGHICKLIRTGDGLELQMAGLSDDGWIDADAVVHSFNPDGHTVGACILAARQVAAYRNSVGRYLV